MSCDDKLATQRSALQYPIYQLVTNVTS